MKSFFSLLLLSCLLCSCESYEASHTGTHKPVVVFLRWNGQAQYGREYYDSLDALVAAHRHSGSEAILLIIDKGVSESEPEVIRAVGYLRENGFEIMKIIHATSMPSAEEL